MGKVGFGLVISTFLLVAPAFSIGFGSYATAGVLQKDGKWEIGVTFADNVNRDSTIFLQNYELNFGTLESLRVVPQDAGVVLTATDLVPDAQSFLTLRNMTTTSGSPLPEMNLSFTNKSTSWVAIGSQELGFPADAVAVGDNGFDLISGGYQFQQEYDEATFVYEQLTGDFDKHVRVDYQDPSSGTARAGLMVREVLDAGKPRPGDPSDPAEAFSRMIEIHATPAITAAGEAASDTHEVGVRKSLGGVDSFIEYLALTNNAAPNYTNAWLRIKRTGQLFEFYRGTNGLDWIQLGSFTFPTNADNGPFPETVFFGPSYSPENGNIDANSGMRAAFLAKFRDYGGIESGLPREAPPIHIARLPTGEVEISWTGQATLETNPEARPTGWTELSATSPYKFTPQAKMAFFRLRV